MKFINNLHSFTSSDLAGFCNYSLLLLCKEGWLTVLDESFCCVVFEQGFRDAAR